MEECHANIWVRSWLQFEKLTSFFCALKKDDKPQETIVTVEENDDISAAANFFQQARGNIDAVMNQNPYLPPVPQEPANEPQPPKKVMVKNRK